MLDIHTKMTVNEGKTLYVLHKI